MIVSADTNLFVYAIDWREPAKREVALEIVTELERRSAPVGLQVVGELQSALHRRLKLPLETAGQQARNLFESFPTFGYDRHEVASALTRSAARLLSYWDALLVAAAETAGVEVLFSEDMHDGGRYGSVGIVNPFGAAGGVSSRARELLSL